MEIKKLRKQHKKKIDRFKQWVKVNSSNLDGEIATVASRLFTVGLKLGEAERLKDRAESILEQTVARVKLKWAKKQVKGKKLTIPEQSARTDIDPSVIEAREIYYDAKYVYNICKSAATSMKEKGNQLTNLANNKRAELNSNIRIKDRDSSIRNKLKS
jgi:hypothetical protein